MATHFFVVLSRWVFSLQQTSNTRTVFYNLVQSPKVALVTVNDFVLFPLKVEVAAGKIVQVLTWWLADPWWKVPRGDLHAPWRCLSSAGRPSEGLEEEAVRAQLEEVEEDTEVTVFCHHIVISTQTKFLVSYLALLPYSCTSFSSSDSI